MDLPQTFQITRIFAHRIRFDAVEIGLYKLAGKGGSNSQNLVISNVFRRLIADDNAIGSEQILIAEYIPEDGQAFLRHHRHRQQQPAGDGWH